MWLIFKRVYPREELTFVGQGHLGDFPFSDGRYHGCPWVGKITLGGDDGRLT